MPDRMSKIKSGRMSDKMSECIYICTLHTDIYVYYIYLLSIIIIHIYRGTVGIAWSKVIHTCPTRTGTPHQKNITDLITTWAGSCYNCSTKCILYEKKHHRRKNSKEEKTTGKHQYLKTNTRTKSFAEEKNKKTCQGDKSVTIGKTLVFLLVYVGRCAFSHLSTLCICLYAFTSAHILCICHCPGCI